MTTRRCCAPIHTDIGGVDLTDALEMLDDPGRWDGSPARPRRNDAHHQARGLAVW